MSKRAVLGLAAASTLIAAAADIGLAIRDSIIVRTIAEVPVKVVAISGKPRFQPTR